VGRINSEGCNWRPNTFTIQIMEIPWVYALTGIAADRRRRVYVESMSGFISRNTRNTDHVRPRAQAHLLVPRSSVSAVQIERSAGGREGARIEGGKRERERGGERERSPRKRARDPRSAVAR